LPSLRLAQQPNRPWHNLLLGGDRQLRLGRKESAGDMERVFELFPHLKERRTQLAGTLSGGERQMLASGRALMARPKLLMLDEPSLALAPLVVKVIFGTIERLRDTGVTLFVVEQNARAALEAADCPYVLEMGEFGLEGGQRPGQGRSRHRYLPGRGPRPSK
jgi:branched-chain amino acid transport system ATP-binding protein